MQAPTTTATIKLADNSTRVLRFSNGALKKVKAEFGVSILRDPLKTIMEKLDEDAIPRLLVLGLDHKWDGGFPGITVDQIDELVETTAALRPLLEAFGASFPEPEKNGGKPETPANPQT